MLSRGRELASPALALAGLVFGLDLLWALVEGSTGSVAYGLVDEPAHLATCAVALLAVAAIGTRLSTQFVVAALVASVAIDLDHLPGYLGSHLLSGDMPRPYSHSALLATALVAAGWAARRRDVRQVAFGIAFGVSMHLFRDLATGPGVPLLWPVAGEVVTLPYPLYASGLAFAALAATTPTVLALARSRLTGAGAILAVLALAMLTGSRPADAAEPVSIGAYVPGSQDDPALLDSYAAEVGHSPLIISNYVDWTRPLIDEDWLDDIWSRGGVPSITWEPWSWSDAGQQFPLQAIADGSYDEFLRGSAAAAAAWGRPILIRFAHEMNGAWYPWGRGHGKRQAQRRAGDYKRAWRHVVSVFRESGAANVSWVWCPYVSNSGQLRFERFYPGDRWVDWVGFDGFNWGSDRVWQSFGKIFGNSYRIASRISSRPIIISETGSTEVGGSKADWIFNTLGRALPRFPRIRALVWFDERFHTVEAKVDSSDSALAALRSGMASPLFQTDREFLLSTSSRLR